MSYVLNSICNSRIREDVLVNVTLGAAGMLLLILLVRYGIPMAFMKRIQYVDDVRLGKRQKFSLITRKAPVPE